MCRALPPFARSRFGPVLECVFSVLQRVTLLLPQEWVVEAGLCPQQKILNENFDILLNENFDVLLLAGRVSSATQFAASSCPPDTPAPAPFVSPFPRVVRYPALGMEDGDGAPSRVVSPKPMARTKTKARASSFVQHSMFDACRRCDVDLVKQLVRGVVRR